MFGNLTFRTEIITNITEHCFQKTFKDCFQRHKFILFVFDCEAEIFWYSVNPTKPDEVCAKAYLLVRGTSPALSVEREIPTRNIFKITSRSK